MLWGRACALPPPFEAAPVPQKNTSAGTPGISPAAATNG